MTIFSLTGNPYMVLFETIRHLRYCTGVEQVNSDEENLPPFLRSMCLQ